jgi:hypothetical protein
MLTFIVRERFLKIGLQPDSSIHEQDLLFQPGVLDRVVSCLDYFVRDIKTDNSQMRDY